MLIWWTFVANWFLLLFNATMIYLNWRLLKRIRRAEVDLVERLMATVAYVERLRDTVGSECDVRRRVS